MPNLSSNDIAVCRRSFELVWKGLGKKRGEHDIYDILQSVPKKFNIIYHQLKMDIVRHKAKNFNEPNIFNSVLTDSNIGREFTIEFSEFWMAARADTHAIFEDTHKFIHDLGLFKKKAIDHSALYDWYVWETIYALVLLYYNIVENLWGRYGALDLLTDEVGVDYYERSLKWMKRLILFIHSKRGKWEDTFNNLTKSKADAFQKRIYPFLYMFNVKLRRKDG